MDEKTFKILQIVILGAVVLIVLRILRTLGITKTGVATRAETKFLTVASSDALSSKYLDPKINTALSGKGVKVLQLTHTSAKVQAKILHDAMYSLFGRKQNEAVGTIEKLKSLTQVASVAKQYELLYNSSLRSDMNDRLWNNAAVDYKTPILQLLEGMKIGILDKNGKIIK